MSSAQGVQLARMANVYVSSKYVFCDYYSIKEMNHMKGSPFFGEQKPFTFGDWMKNYSIIWHPYRLLIGL